jgi:transposase
MWKILVACYVLGIPSIQALIRRLNSDYTVALQCGILKTKETPGRFAYYKFTKKLIQFLVCMEECMMARLMGFKASHNDFTKSVAVDSKDVKLYCNQHKKRCSDRDAKYGYKEKANNKP